MKKAIRLLALFIPFLFVSCDEHEKVVIDTDLHIGQVLCSDGSVIDYSKLDTKTHTPVGVVFSTNNEGTRYTGRGYAVLLKESGRFAFADSLGYQQHTNTSLTAYAGFGNTYNMYMSASPLATSLMVSFPTYQSAFIPSVAEMRELYAAKNVINPILESLGGDILPINSEAGYYWTSTEVSGQDALQAYTYSTSAAQILPALKEIPYKTRPVVIIYE